MGYDANKKVASKRRSAAQRLAAVAALLLLAGAFVVAVSFLRPPSSGAAAPGGAGTARGATARRVRTAKAKDTSRASKTTSDRTRAPGKARARESSGASRASEEAAAAAARAALEDRVRALKKTGVIMEADAESRRLTAQLQDATRELLALRYGDIGDRNYRVRLDLEFQPTLPDFAEKGKEGSLLVELAPVSLLPCSVYNFLEIARTWKKGAFHRNADHVLQAIARSDVTRPMPFQEYRREYPHRRGTLGYAGRPSGPEFYVRSVCTCWFSSSKHRQRHMRPSNMFVCTLSLWGC